MPIITSYSLTNSVTGALNTFVTTGDQARPSVEEKGNWRYHLACAELLDAIAP